TLLSPEMIHIPYIDYHVASIRKWFGIPDGSIGIKTKGSFSNRASSEENTFSTLRKKALQLKNLYIQTGKQTLKNEYRILFAKADASLDDGFTPHQITSFSLNELVIKDIVQISEKRKSNYNTLYTMLKGNSAITLLQECYNNSVPFTMPILVENRDLIQRELAKNGVYASILWPIDDEAARICKNSENFSKHMLALPIDQRYDYCDMARIYEVIDIVL
ncbi:MAG: hypothetical protein WA125_17920, partial [Desulfosporosinus sp.]